MYSFRDLSNYYVLFIKSSIKSNDLDYMGVMGRRIANLVPEKNCSESWQKKFGWGVSLNPDPTGFYSFTS